MTKQDALKKLESAPIFDQCSHLNKGLSMRQCFDIVNRAIDDMQDGEIPDWATKRVNQICHPKY